MRNLKLVMVSFAGLAGAVLGFGVTTTVIFAGAMFLFGPSLEGGGGAMVIATYSGILGGLICGIVAAALAFSKAKSVEGRHKQDVTVA